MTKVTIIIVSMLLALCAVFFTLGLIVGQHNSHIKNYYGMTAEVVDISRPLDRVTIKDSNGNLWQFDGIEDYEVGDFCSCVMNDNNTELIFDDEIVSVQYAGYFENWGN